jgi:hypothetical protein
VEQDGQDIDRQWGPIKMGLNLKDLTVVHDTFHVVIPGSHPLPLDAST